MSTFTLSSFTKVSSKSIEAFNVDKNATFTEIDTKQDLLAHVQDGRLGIVHNDTLTQVIGLKRYNNGDKYYEVITSNGGEHTGNITQTRMLIGTGKYLISTKMQPCYESVHKVAEWNQRVLDDKLIDDTFEEFVAKYGVTIKERMNILLGFVKALYIEAYDHSDVDWAKDCFEVKQVLEDIIHYKYARNYSPVGPWYRSYLLYVEDRPYGASSDINRYDILQLIKNDSYFKEHFLNYIQVVAEKALDRLYVHQFEHTKE